ncbi:uncharacterized protein J7T54_006692 [Emericellopsis cladophorae]|uniref:ABC transmembrane type-1 domain-containing protein n=1 Tax=Emericellopsis cladophorae TaxID=2686198 RepID=A0A9P9Y709_9HYPO|nr:uncharacterized protein J7T54_006692 [Emericellopsis cladophorae]KAI6784646.1 hypothetical protein J7T54_006692 [Emericellopsis cladophorae]
MNLVFGRFVTTFNDSAIGAITPDNSMKEVSRYALYFIYPFIARFFLVYIHTILVSLVAICVTSALRIEFLQSLLRQDMTYSTPIMAAPRRPRLITFGVVSTIVIVTGVCMTIEVKSENELMSVWSQASLLTQSISTTSSQRRDRDGGRLGHPRVASLPQEKKMLYIYQQRMDAVASNSTKTLAFTMLWYAFLQSVNMFALP